MCDLDVVQYVANIENSVFASPKKIHPQTMPFTIVLKEFNAAKEIVRNISGNIDSDSIIKKACDVMKEKYGIDMDVYLFERK